MNTIDYLLPDEIILHFYSFLDKNAKLNFMLTQRKYYHICLDDLYTESPNKFLESRIESINNMLIDMTLESMFDNKICDTVPINYIQKNIFDIQNLLDTTNTELQYHSSTRSEYNFLVKSKNNQKDYMLKIFPVNKWVMMQENNFDSCMFKLLSYFVINKQTQHIVLPIVAFDTDIQYFCNNVPTEITNTKNEKFKIYRDFLKKYYLYKPNVSALICEWCNGDYLSKYINQNHTTMTAP